MKRQKKKMLTCVIDYYREMGASISKEQYMENTAKKKKHN